MNISRFSLKEKLKLFSGDGNSLIEIIKAATMIGYSSRPFGAGKMPQYDYPGMQFSDGPRGIVLGHSTCFPVAISRAATWDVELEKEIGRAIGMESRAQGGNTWGGVCVNLIRHPAWGRAQESYGEDPVLLGRMGAAVTEGAQEHVIACIKHFALNSVEIARFKINVKIEARPLHEIYLPHFRMCIDAGAGAVMSAYNKMNGRYCGENRHLLTDILRDQWGFKGFVVSDWVLGVRNGIRGFRAGLDMEMPAKFRFAALPFGIRRGMITLERIDAAAHNIFDTVMESEKKKKSSYPSMDVLRKNHAPLALDAARRGIVLLRNETVDGMPLLPLKPDAAEKYALIGKLAGEINIGDHGSSRVRPLKVRTILKAVQNGLASLSLTVDKGNDIEKAAELAKQADTVILVAGYRHHDEGEYIPLRGGDRKSLRLSSHDENLIDAVAKANPRTIVVMIGGSAIVTPWSERVNALLMAWYPGQEGGQAVWDVISGRVNPCGKLPVVFPMEESHTPFFDRNAKEITYDHYHGYRYLNKHGLKPRFAFGFGLSYTCFIFSDPVLDWRKEEQKGTLCLTVANNGKYDGAEVIQLYAGYSSGKIDRPAFELKDFRRIELAIGEGREVVFNVSARQFAYWRPESKDWFTPAGLYQFYAGTSSRPEDLKSVDCKVARDEVFDR